MRLRLVFSLVVLLVGILSSGPAWARPCCSDCDSWPDLDPFNDPCARVCDFSCFAPQPLSPRPDGGLLQQIFSHPARTEAPNLCTN